MKKYLRYSIATFVLIGLILTIAFYQSFIRNKVDKRLVAHVFICVQNYTLNNLKYPVYFEDIDLLEDELDVEVDPFFISQNKINLYICRVPFINNRNDNDIPKTIEDYSIIDFFHNTPLVVDSMQKIDLPCDLDLHNQYFKLFSDIEVNHVEVQKKALSAMGKAYEKVSNKKYSSHVEPMMPLTYYIIRNNGGHLSVNTLCDNIKDSALEARLIQSFEDELKHNYLIENVDSIILATSFWIDTEE